MKYALSSKNASKRLLSWTTQGYPSSPKLKVMYCKHWCIYSVCWCDAQVTSEFGCYISFEDLRCSFLSLWLAAILKFIHVAHTYNCCLSLESIIRSWWLVGSDVISCHFFIIFSYIFHIFMFSFCVHSISQLMPMPVMIQCLILAECPKCITLSSSPELVRAVLSCPSLLSQ